MAAKKGKGARAAAPKGAAAAPEAPAIQAQPVPDIEPIGGAGYYTSSWRKVADVLLGLGAGVLDFLAVVAIGFAAVAAGQTVGALFYVAYVPLGAVLISLNIALWRYALRRGRRYLLVGAIVFALAPLLFYGACPFILKPW